MDGAVLVTAELTAGGEAGLILTVRVHMGEEGHVRLNGLSEGDARVIAPQVPGGVRVEGRAGGSPTSQAATADPARAPRSP